MPTLPTTMPPTEAPQGHARRPSSVEASRVWPLLARLTRATLIDLVCRLLAERLGKKGKALTREDLQTFIQIPERTER